MSESETTSSPNSSGTDSSVDAPGSGHAPGPSADEAPELPNSVSYVVIALVVTALGGYAWWSSTQLDAAQAKFVNQGDVEAQSQPLSLGVYWSMEPSLVNLEDIIFAGIPRDGIQALKNPKTVAISEAKFDPRMRVVGVTVKGKHRAYPLSLLLHHEVINDELGGVPIAVTLSPPSETATVYDRRIGDETLELGVAGRVYRSTSLLFDRRQEEAQESLWRQYDGVAITGPAAADKKTLPRLDSIVTSWSRWKKLHPEADAVSEDTGLKRDYTINPHAESYKAEVTSFPLPKPSGRRPKMKQKSQVVIVSTGAISKGYFLDDLRAIKGTMVDDTIGDQAIKIGYPETALVIEGPPELIRFQSYWLAVDAMQPKLSLWDPAQAQATKKGDSGESGDSGEEKAGDETGTDRQ